MVRLKEPTTKPKLSPYAHLHSTMVRLKEEMIKA